MEKFIFVTFLVVIVFSAGVESSSIKVKNLNLITVIQQVTRAFLLKRTKVLTVSLQAKDRSMLAIFGEIVDEILKHLDYVKVQIDGGDCDTNGYRQFNILFVDSFEAFKRIDPASKTKDSDINEFYLIFLKMNSDQTAYHNELLQMFDYCWSHYIINVSVLVDKSPGLSELYTYFPFSKMRCRNVSPVLINVIKNGNLTKGVDHIFPKKLHDLHSCHLTAALWDSPPYLRIFPNETGLQRFIDFEGVLLGVLARKVNFSLEYIVPPNDEQRGRRFLNGTTNGAMKLLQDRKTDLSLGSFRYTLERTEVLTATLPYYQTWQIFGVLKTSLPYTSIEILMFPFDISTWLSLMVFIGIIIAFGLLAVYQRTKFAKLHLEVSLNNLLACFLGIPMPQLPRRNFTRYLLMMWIIFAFVMRCAYQSLLFQLLQSNLYRKPPNKIDELISRDYTLVMTKGTFDSVNTIPAIKYNQIRYMIIDSPSELSVFEFVEHTPGRFAGVSPMDFCTFYAMTESGRGIFHILREKIFPQHVAMYFTKHSFLIERFNELLMNLRSFGLIDFWAKQSLDETYFGEVDSAASATTAMTLKQFRGLFEVYLVLITVAFLGFLLEVCSKRVKVLGRVLECVH